MRRPEAPRARRAPATGTDASDGQGPAERARGASRTAVGVAALRWLHQTVDGAPRILDDPVSGALLGEAALRAIVSRFGDPGAPGLAALRSHVVLRARYCEDRLAAAVERGVTQLVILGAGLDTFAYRQPPWARPLRIFEVDHPASQREKRALLDRAGIPVPANVAFVAIDFETTTLASGLRAGGVDSAAKTFFSCLGVTMYLTEQAVDALFGAVAEFPPGSEIVFTYRAADAGADGALGRSVSAMGEPWTFRAAPDAMAGKLRSLGFCAMEELDPADAERAYFRGRVDALRAPARRGIAAAVVSGASSGCPRPPGAHSASDE